MTSLIKVFIKEYENCTNELEKLESEFHDTSTNTHTNININTEDNSSKEMEAKKEAKRLRAKRYEMLEKKAKKEKRLMKEGKKAVLRDIQEQERKRLIRSGDYSSLIMEEEEEEGETLKKVLIDNKPFLRSQKTDLLFDYDTFRITGELVEQT